MNLGLHVLSGIILVGAVCGCSSENKAADGTSVTTDAPLTSDMTLRSVQYFVEHQDEALEVRKACDAWKGSQRPVMSWPSVVMQNCENEGTAHATILQRKNNDHMMQQMGVKPEK